LLRAAQEQEIQTKQQQLLANRSKQANDAITSVLDVASQLSEAFRTGQTTLTPEQYQQEINKLVNVASRTAQLGTQAGLQVMSPEIIEAQKQKLLASPTPEQLAATEGRAAVAGAEATAQAAGVPTASVLQAKGLTPGAPTTREILVGDQVLTQEFVPGQGWVNVAVGKKQPGVVVNTGEQISGAGSMAATKELGKGIGKRANDRITQAFDAQRQNLQLERVKAALGRGAQTGLGEETLLDLRNLAGTVFGIQNSEQMAEQELIRTVSNEMALRLRNPESGLGLTGNTSNKDLQFLKNSVIGLNRTELGNVKLIDLMQRFNQLKLDTAREQARIIAENDGVVPNDLDQKLMDFVDKYEFLTDQEIKEIRSLTQGAPKSGLIQNPDGSFTYVPKR
jgi:hypothetical protein